MYYILIYVLTGWHKTNVTEVDILCLNKMPDILQWILNAFIFSKKLCQHPQTLLKFVPKAPGARPTNDISIEFEIRPVL